MKLGEIISHTNREKLANKIITRLIIIPASEGDIRISLDYLNYIDIEQRSLCYHLWDDDIKARCILRTSFAKAVEHYLHNDNLIFLKPSLLINMDNIEFLNKDHIIFSNGKILYFPKKHYQEIYNRWVK